MAEFLKIQTATNENHINLNRITELAEEIAKQIPVVITTLGSQGVLVKFNIPICA